MCRDGFVRCRGVSGDGMRDVGIGLWGLWGACWVVRNGYKGIELWESGLL